MSYIINSDILRVFYYALRRTIPFSFDLYTFKDKPMLNISW